MKHTNWDNSDNSKAVMVATTSVKKAFNSKKLQEQLI
jgi:hypothetical protein